MLPFFIGESKMVAPVFQAILSKTGRTLYKKGSGFISKNEFLRETRRIKAGVKGAGRFLSRADHARSLSVSEVAQRIHAEIGPPLGDANWVSRVRKSTEKFIDFLADENAIG